MLNLSISKRRKNRTMSVRHEECSYAESENKAEIGGVNPCDDFVTHASPVPARGHGSGSSALCASFAPAKISSRRLDAILFRYI
jgi:hypothetical protein